MTHGTGSPTLYNELDLIGADLGSHILGLFPVVQLETSWKYYKNSCTLNNTILHNHLPR